MDHSDRWQHSLNEISQTKTNTVWYLYMYNLKTKQNTK